MKTLNYTTIFLDIVANQFPERLNDEELIRKIKKIQTNLDVLEINDVLFPKSSLENNKEKQEMKSYTEEDIKIIFDYQKKHKLNMKQTANNFSMSRNTLKKWKDRNLG
jgi:hypothetical protein